MSSKATSPVAKMLRREEREVEVQEGKETPGRQDMGISYIQSKKGLTLRNINIGRAKG